MRFLIYVEVLNYHFGIECLPVAFSLNSVYPPLKYLIFWATEQILQQEIVIHQLLKMERSYYFVFDKFLLVVISRILNSCLGNNLGNFWNVRYPVKRSENFQTPVYVG